MPVLTTLTQFEQYDLETDMCDAAGITRSSAAKILVGVFVPEFEKRVTAAAARVLDAAVVDLERAQRIAQTPMEGLSPEDLVWWRARAQTTIRELDTMPRAQWRPALVEWLRAVSLRGAA